jgi:hypothetical protein
VNVPLVPPKDELELGAMDMEELLDGGSTMELLLNGLLLELLATLGEETAAELELL